MASNDEIILGSGDLFLIEYTGDTIPEDLTFETEVIQWAE